MRAVNGVGTVSQKNGLISIFLYRACSEKILPCRSADSGKYGKEYVGERYR